jgi:hypothetical protein
MLQARCIRSHLEYARDACVGYIQEKKTLLMIVAAFLTFLFPIL